MLIFSFLVIGFGCAKKEADNNAVHTYTYVNGQCYDQTTGQYTTMNYCGNVSNNGYIYQNGICIQTATGQQVQPTLCQFNNGGLNGGGLNGGMQCYGQYIYIQNGITQPVQCTGQNCRGYTLIQQSTGQQVYCQ
jgi:hypothetical protein